MPNDAIITEIEVGTPHPMLIEPVRGSGVPSLADAPVGTENRKRTSSSAEAHPPASLEPEVDGSQDEKDTSIEATARERDEEYQYEYQNSLVLGVGFLELFNALDFRANVWNTIPIPMFAMVLMGIGGSVATLGTGFAVWDLVRSKRNINFLLLERKALKARHDQQQYENPSSLRTIQAWLDVNFRELGWELVDRAIMDALMTISGLMVGAGTLMAMRGDIPIIFLVSNLLSGYIGNSFVAAYAVLNATWGFYMWLRARRHSAALVAAGDHVDHNRLLRSRTHAKKHQLYAAANSMSTLIAGAGSLVSAKHWSGYVILLPCIVGSIFCNVYWRTRLGYCRSSYDVVTKGKDFDISARLDALASARQDNVLVKGQRRLIHDEERFLLELYACYMHMADVKKRSRRVSLTEKGENSQD